MIHTAKLAAMTAMMLLTLAACSTKYYYTKGLNDAQHPTPGDVHNGLVMITPGNNKLVRTTINGQQYVLAATWKQDSTYYTNKDSFDSKLGYYRYNTGNYPIWVSMAPQLQDMKLGGLNDKKLQLRLQQLLGLPPTANYNYFLELWVKPEDVFRPCFNPSTTTDVCPFTASKQDMADANYINWLFPYIYNSYSDTSVYGRYPFTHLGYTYDWSPKNKTHVGLSEFVIGKNKNIFVKKVYTTRGYIGG